MSFNVKIEKNQQYLQHESSKQVVGNSDLPAALKGKKVSEVFLEYVTPFLENLMNDGIRLEFHEIEQALRVPWCVWNASVLQDDSIMQQLMFFIKDSPAQAKQIILNLKSRKINYFSEYKYSIGKYSVFLDKHTQEIRLRAEARENKK